MDALLASNSAVSFPHATLVSQNAASAALKSSHSSRLSVKVRPSEFWGGKCGISVVEREAFQPKNGAHLRIEMTISREVKVQTIQKAKEQLENCTLIAGINYAKLTVKQFQDLRARLPESASLIVMKNRLLYKAIEGTEFENLKPCMKGMNAFLFVHSEEIPPSLKPYRELQKELKLEGDYTGAVFEGKFYGPEDFKALESMPSRAEVLAKLLGVFKAPSSQLVGVLQAPARDLVLTLKAHVAKLEEEAGQAS